MAVRIQLRRDTAANWVAANPVLRAGEFGVETDTLKVKVGDGTTAWNSISAYLNVTPSNLTTELSNYILSSTKGAINGVAALDGSKNLIVPGTSVIIEGATADSYETTLVATDPTDDRTITLPDATGTVALTSDITSAINAISTTDIEEGTNLYFTDERAQDAVGGMLTGNTETGITVTYDDSTAKIDFAVADQFPSHTTTDLTEGTNLYFTDERAQDAVATALSNGTHTNITVTYSDSTNAISLNASGNVSSVSGTANQIAASSSSGAVTLSLPNAVTFPGTVTLNADPTQALQAVTKQYVDNAIEGLAWKSEVNLLSNSNIALTGSTGTLVIDGHAALGDSDDGYRILLKNQTTNSENGIYVYSDNGTTYTLTRASDADVYTELISASVYVLEGTTYGGTAWIQSDHYLSSFAGQNWVQFSGAGTITAGTGITVNGLQVSINTATTVDTSTAQTLTNKTLTLPKVNEAVDLTATSTELNILDGATLSTTELNYVDGVTSAIQTQLDGKIDESLFDAKGDLLVGGADNTPAKLSIGTDGYLLTANSAATNGVSWSPAPVSLPSQTGNEGKYLTTDGTTASWGTLVVPIVTGTATITANTATTIDNYTVQAGLAIEYMVTMKQGSKIRTSKVIVHSDGSSVDSTEFSIMELGGTMTGVSVTATSSGSAGYLTATVTDAATTNVNVKFSKVVL